MHRYRTLVSLVDCTVTSNENNPTPQITHQPLLEFPLNLNTVPVRVITYMYMYTLPETQHVILKMWHWHRLGAGFDFDSPIPTY